MASLIEARVPDIGNNKDVPVIELLVKVGDTVSRDQGLLTLESDKASMEVPSPVAGVLKELRVALGDKLAEGMVVAVIEVAEAAAKPAATPEPVAAAVPTPVAAAPAPAAAPSSPVVAAAPAAAAVAAPAIATPAQLSGALPHASPAIRRFARELGVDLRALNAGTGRKARITREDVQNYVKAQLAAPRATTSAPASSAGGGLNLLPWPDVDFSKFGTTERVDLSRIKKLSGANLARNWAMIPHVTQNDEADITEMEAFRKSTAETLKDVKLTPLVFMIKAVVAGLKKFPSFNASLDPSGEQLVLKRYFHIGIAVDTPNGLVVPVIRDCDRKSLVELARELGEISVRARDKKLGPADMQGGCFSISSLGGIGGTGFTPIINAPEVAILGVSRSQIRPVWNGSEFLSRLMLPLSLSYDHRVIDGAEAARFAAYVAQQLGDIRRLLL